MEQANEGKSEVWSCLRKLMTKLGIGTNAFAEIRVMSSQSVAHFCVQISPLMTITMYWIAKSFEIDTRDVSFL